MTPKHIAEIMMLVVFAAPGAAARSNGQIPAQSHQPVTAATPQRIIEREGSGCVASGTDYGIVWSFDGLRGMGRFDFTEQQMDIESFDGHTLVVRRTSYAGVASRNGI